MQKLLKSLFALCLIIPLVHCAANKDTTHTWQQMGYYWPIPNDAVIGGLDPTGVQLFVGRAEHAGTIYPAKIHLANGQAYIAVGDKEFKKQEYDILTGSGYTWEDSFDGLWVRGAVSPGTNPNGQPTYVCRATSFGGILIGSMTYSSKVCNVSDRGVTTQHNGYQVLVKH